MFDIELEFFDATNARFVDEGANALCLLKQSEVVVAGHLNADRSARGRPLTVLVHRDLYARISPDALPYFIEHLLTFNALPEFEFDKAHGDLGLVGRLGHARALVGVAGAFAHLSDHRLHHEVVRTRGRLGISVFVQGLQDHFFYFSGDPIRALDIGADGHFDVDIGQVGLVLREEQCLGREGAHKHEAQHEHEYSTTEE